MAAETTAAVSRIGARPRVPLLRHAPTLTLAILLVPILAGLAGTFLPAFGYLPALGGHALDIEAWRMLFAAPELPGAIRLTVTTGIAATVIALVLALGFCAATHGTRLSRRLRPMLAPILSLPHAAVAIGLAYLIAPSGWAMRWISP